MTRRSRSKHLPGAAALQVARIAALAVSTLAGCGLAPAEEVGSAAGAFTPMCSQGRRWVAEVPSTAACHGVGDWGAELILGNEPLGSAPTYCAFEWQLPTAVDAPGLALLAGQVGSAPLAEDCMFVGSLGAPAADLSVAARLTDSAAEVEAYARLAEGPATRPPSASLASFGQELREDLRLRFAERAGAVALPASTSHEPTHRPYSVRVAVVDSEPDTYEGNHPGQLRHGAVMAGLVRDLSCPAGQGDPLRACLSDVATHLALPHIDDEKIDRFNGGYFGTIGELASALTAAADRFRHDGADDEGVSRLVINLSLGVQPSDLACSGDPAMPGARLLDRVLYTALQRAACHGAIIVAAAGNDPGGGPYVGGATCPAAWASLPAPSLETCQDLFGIEYVRRPLADVADPTAPQAPLLYAVHAVDASDTPVVNARDGARGWIAAPGLLGASPDGSGSLPAPLTGSSVAAAAVSGMAAAVWAYRPELSGREVMNLLQASGVKLEEPATLCPPGAANAGEPWLSAAQAAGEASLPGTCDARRASLCQALTQACAGHHARCPQLPPCPSSDPLPVQNAPIAPHVAAQLAPLAAGAEQRKAEGGFVTPSDIYPAAGAAPWVEPQPTSPPCGPACVLDLSGWLYFSIDPEFGQPVNEVVLKLTGTTSTPVRRLGNNFTPGRLYSFPMTELGIVRTASLSFDLGTGTSTTEQILIRR